MLSDLVIYLLLARVNVAQVRFSGSNPPAHFIGKYTPVGADFSPLSPPLSYFLDGPGNHYFGITQDKNDLALGVCVCLDSLRDINFSEFGGSKSNSLRIWVKREENY